MVLRGAETGEERLHAELRRGVTSPHLRRVHAAHLVSPPDHVSRVPATADRDAVTEGLGPGTLECFWASGSLHSPLEPVSKPSLQFITVTSTLSGAWSCGSPSLGSALPPKVHSHQEALCQSAAGSYMSAAGAAGSGKGAPCPRWPNDAAKPHGSCPRGHRAVGDSVGQLGELTLMLGAMQSHRERLTFWASRAGSAWHSVLS